MNAKFVKKLLTAVALVIVVAALFALNAYACTTIYVGGSLTEDGAPIVARSEDYTNSASKLLYISPAGEYKAGATYLGCAEYGEFEWVWTHDSYRFNAFTADVYHDGVCPECGKSGHPSYTESGTNEKGVIVSATETISGTKEIRAIDPYCRTKADGKVGIEETDLPTIVLSEAATAREGVNLLLKIYDEYGCYGGSGLFIADQKEVWYIENCTGTQYIALKLNNDLMFLEPNLPVIGLIDLDDKDNVIASPRLIEVAKLAETFVGNEAENQIDFRASYAANSANARLVNGLNFVNKEYNYESANLTDDNSLFTISNVKDGKQVALYTNITADRPITPDDIANYYKVDGIANTGNTDTAFFQLYADRPVELGTVEWTSMSHGAYNVFIPCYPLLLDSVYEGYGAAVGEATKNVAEKPETGLFYRAVNSRTGEMGKYVVLPENWEKSFYWSFDGLSNYILYSGNDDDPVTEEELAYVLAQYADLQEEIYNNFHFLNMNLNNFFGSNPAKARELATSNYSSMSELTHRRTLTLIDYLTTGFTDVKKTAYYGDAVIWAVNNKITNGTGDRLFSPDYTCSRAQIVTLLWRALGSPAPKAPSAFTDVDANAYYADAVAWAVENGITNGATTTTFRPNDPCTRAQIVTFLYRASGENALSISAFSDVDPNAYYAAAVTWAVMKGITNGTSATTFSPARACTRAQCVSLLYRWKSAPLSPKQLVGISMPTSVLQRWNQDGFGMKEKLNALGYAVDLQFADNDVALQVAQIEEMIDCGAKVIVVTAFDPVSLGSVMAKAKEAGCTVIAYDRLILDSDAVSYYVTFDNNLVGMMQGQYIADKLDLANAGSKHYNIEFITGDVVDPISSVFYRGAMSVLQPYLNSGVLVCESGQVAFENVATYQWDTIRAQDRFENILSTYYSDKQLDAVMASNDSTAQGVTNALGTSYRNSVYPIITGQDCDIVSVMNMLNGHQAMSIFKDTRDLVAKTAEMCQAILEGSEPPINDTMTYDNGVCIVPSYLCAPKICTKENYKELLIDSGYYSAEMFS